MAKETDNPAEPSDDQDDDQTSVLSAMKRRLSAMMGINEPTPESDPDRVKKVSQFTNSFKKYNALNNK